MKHTITLIPGDGIGPEVTKPTVEIIEAAGVKVTWETYRAGAEALKKHGATIPKALMDSFEKNRVALKGPVTTPVGEGFSSVNVELRQTFELYANLRPIKNLPGVKARYQDVDLIIVRENTEGLYSGIEHEVVPGVMESLKIMTAKACTRIAKFAFAYARKYRRKKVSAVHKANIMKLTDGLFLECARNISKQYKDIAYSEIIIDNACMQLVLNPLQFDTLLLENLYGDIVSDLAAGLVGGLGVVAGANLSDTHGLFEPVHGSAPDIKGKGIANPTAMISAAIMMLNHINERAAAKRISAALETVLKSGTGLTPDLGGSATTKQFAEAIRREIEK
ncbi:MAG TPA: isocitrate dehydrogenase (NAD(+)) [Terriglobales bacterium]|jgi:isocitrate dehydrogenase (NAD+)|nr:isocitrate dehydrogenase (NAD(+)) [Terriglobales bacterium]